MSIAHDIRTYADTAVNQGKQALGSTLATAQAQLESVTDIADKAAETVQDLRDQAEKAINLDALAAAIEPYLTQLKEYTSLVTTKVDGFVAGALQDPRFAKLVETAESFGIVVLGTVNVRVVKPVQSFAGMGKSTASTLANKTHGFSTTPATESARTPATTRSAAMTPTVPVATPAKRKPAATKPVGTKSAASSKPAASKPAASKPAASKPAASKPASSKSAAAKSAATKSAATKSARKSATPATTPATRAAARKTAAKSAAQV